MTEKTLKLKRTVTTKAIVTEDFKKYLEFELNNALRDIDNKLKTVENQGNQLLATLKESGADQQIQAINQQMELERQQSKQAKDDLLKRIENARKLENGTEFLQGTVEGFVDVKVGDNLYEKLGATEVVIKDGEVLEIRELGKNKPGAES